MNNIIFKLPAAKLQFTALKLAVPKGLYYKKFRSLLVGRLNLLEIFELSALKWGLAVRY